MHKRAASRGRHLSWALATSTAILMALAATANATPKGEFAQFAQCPLKNSATKACLYAKSTGGEFAIGSTVVSLTKPITLQGGLTKANSEGDSEVLAATNGETVSKTPETVPGGLLKIVAPSWLPGWLQAIFNEYINKGLTGVTETTELAGTAFVNPLATLGKSGTGLILPTRVHLENVFLGSGCYIGSSAHPVTVDFTTGTTSPPPPNEPITGSAGTLEVKGEGEILALVGGALVNNTFAAPEAEGCGGLFSFLIDPAVDAELGLPSAAGHNTAILDGSQEIAGAEGVRESES